MWPPRTWPDIALALCLGVSACGEVQRDDSSELARAAANDPGRDQGRDPKSGRRDVDEPSDNSEETAHAIQFVDMAAEAGLSFRHTNGPTTFKYFPETAGGGGMFWDYDGDGLLDIYLVNSGWVTSADRGAADRDGAAVNALYRNAGGKRLTEVGARAGVADAGYGMGCASGDYDNDGDGDLFVTNYGPNVLFRNERHGDDGPTPGENSFADVTAAHNLGDDNWGTGCAFADYDLDGDLDLYVANYVDYVPERDVDTGIPYLPAQDVDGYEGDIRGYPHPGSFRGTADLLYRNEGAAGFVDVTRTAGLYDEGGKGLGVIFGDCDGDGWPDLYVANDLVRNYLFFNNGDGTFREDALRSGTSFGQDGQVEAGMGTDFGDYDNDGDLDITVTNFQKEPNTLYRNEGTGFFANETFASGIGLTSLPPLGFGTGFFDFDNDGLQDLFVANGHVLDNVHLFDQSTTYAQLNLLLRNTGPNRYGKVSFADVSAASGPGLRLEQPSRGSASGDFDNDGDVDLLVVNLGGPAVLLRNDGGNRANWLSVETRGVASNRDGIGARIRAVAGDLTQTKEVRGSRSYLSQSDLRVHFGLGAAAAVDSLVISWPGGADEVLTDIAANQFIRVQEGLGVVADRRG